MARPGGRRRRASTPSTGPATGRSRSRSRRTRSSSAAPASDAPTPRTDPTRLASRARVRARDCDRRGRRARRRRASGAFAGLLRPERSSAPYVDRTLLWVDRRAAAASAVDAGGRGRAAAWAARATGMVFCRRRSAAGRTATARSATTVLAPPRSWLHRLDAAGPRRGRRRSRSACDDRARGRRASTCAPTRPRVRPRRTRPARHLVEHHRSLRPSVGGAAERCFGGPARAATVVACARAVGPAAAAPRSRTSMLPGRAPRPRPRPRRSSRAAARAAPWSRPELALHRRRRRRLAQASSTPRLGFAPVGSIARARPRLTQDRLAEHGVDRGRGRQSGVGIAARCAGRRRSRSPRAGSGRRRRRRPCAASHAHGAPGAAAVATSSVQPVPCARRGRRARRR